MSKKIDTLKNLYNRYITCPYCGWEDKDSWEANHENETETECGRCEKEFVCLANVEVTWSTW